MSGHRPLRRRVDFALLRIARPVKNSTHEQDAQNVPHVFIHRRLRNRAGRDSRQHFLRRKKVAAIPIFLRALGREPLPRHFPARHFDIHPRVHRTIRAVCAAPIRNHKSRKSPFLAQHVLQQIRILRTIQPVHFLIGGHHRPNPRFLHRRLKRWKINFLQRALVNRFIHAVAFEFLIVRREMFHRGDHAFALHPFDISDADTRRQIRILSVSLKISAPQRHALNVHCRAQNHVATNRPYFLPQRLPRRLRRLRIPGSRHRNP